MKKILFLASFVFVVLVSIYLLLDKQNSPALKDDLVINESDEIVLKSSGLGVVDFGASEQQVLDILSPILGEPTKDTGLIDSFSVYGTCPGSNIRVIEWGRLRIFFGDTKYGPQNFFQYEYTGRDTEKQTPVLATEDGITLNTSRVNVLTHNPNVVINPWIEDYETMVLNNHPEYLGGTIKAGKVFWISGGVQCGD